MTAFSIDLELFHRPLPEISLDEKLSIELAPATREVAATFAAAAVAALVAARPWFLDAEEFDGEDFIPAAVAAAMDERDDDDDGRNDDDDDDDEFANKEF